MVVSVGPYPLTYLRPGAHRATNSGVDASPPTDTTARSSNSVGSTDPNTAGVMIACVTLSSASNCANSAPPRTDGGTTTKLAPRENATIHSSTDGSKLGTHMCKKRDAASTPYNSTASASNAFKPPCVTATPFGRPVEPDV
ncbi:hypothetical protein MLGJGCBP_03137 [Rhodococcus sp. T7]|nr:hypothetical protein MLGJGCBP_03137 [Rhodococcus sp. T7]